MYRNIYIYIEREREREREREHYKITHLPGRPQGPLLFSPDAVVVFAPLPVDPVSVLVLAAAAFVGSVVGCDAAAAPAPPSSHGKALATVP